MFAATSAQAAATTVVPQAFHFSGNTVFDDARLGELIADRLGQAHTLADLEGVARRVTTFYRNQGYLVAQAYLPPQEIRDGRVQIRVVEGRYSEIDIQNESNLNDAVAQHFMRALRPGDLVTADLLEQTNLLLSDLPGVDVVSTLVPGAASGTTRLVVTVRDASKSNGRLEVDTHGNPYLGRFRTGMSYAMNNPGGAGDLLAFQGLISGGGLMAGNVSYKRPIWAPGTQIGATLSTLNYTLGEEMKLLGAGGSTQSIGLVMERALTRTESTRLFGEAGLELRWITDELFAETSRKRTQALTADLSGSTRDGQGGVAWYGAGFKAGNLEIDTEQARDADAQTAGAFTKWTMQASSLSRPHGNLRFYGAIRAQMASRNLDSSERFVLGGASKVRAYPQGEASGDQGWLGTVEARYSLPARMSLSGNAAAALFYDVGSVTINKEPWDGSANQRTLSGIGVGLAWSGAGGFSLRLDHAWKLGGGALQTSGEATSQTWLRMSLEF